MNNSKFNDYSVSKNICKIKNTLYIGYPDDIIKCNNIKNNRNMNYD